MTEDLNHLPHAIALHVARLECVRAIGIFGSRANPQYEAEGGDWDFFAFINLNAIPDKASRDRLWSAPDSPAKGRAIVHEGHNDRFAIPGVHIELEYIPIAEFQRRIDRVFRDADIRRQTSDWCTLGACPEAACADAAMCRPLWDPDGLIAEWKRAVARYPQAFRLNIFHRVLFELRFKLKYMPRAAELNDAAYFHMTLSEFCFGLMRLLFALNRVYFRGAKRALRELESFPLAPEDCAARLRELLTGGLPPGRMESIPDEAKRLTQETVDLIRAQGEEERQAIERGLWNWPDVEPVE